MTSQSRKSARFATEAEASSDGTHGSGLSMTNSMISGALSTSLDLSKLYGPVKLKMAPRRLRNYSKMGRRRRLHYENSQLAAAVPDELLEIIGAKRDGRESAMMLRHEPLKVELRPVPPPSRLITTIKEQPGFRTKNMSVSARVGSIEHFESSELKAKLALQRRLRSYSLYNIENLLAKVGLPEQLLSKPLLNEVYLGDITEEDLRDMSLQVDAALPLCYFDDGLDSYVEMDPPALLRKRAEENEDSGIIEFSAMPFQQVKYSPEMNGWPKEGGVVVLPRVRAWALFSRQEHGPFEVECTTKAEERSRVHIEEGVLEINIPTERQRSPVDHARTSAREAGIVKKRVWLPCTVVGLTGTGADVRYLVHWDNILDTENTNDPTDSHRAKQARLPCSSCVHRLNLLLFGEDPVAFAERVAKAFYAREQALAMLQFGLCVESMPSEEETSVATSSNADFCGQESKALKAPGLCIARVLERVGKAALASESARSRPQRRQSLRRSHSIAVISSNDDRHGSRRPSEVGFTPHMPLSPHLTNQVREYLARGYNTILLFYYLKTVQAASRIRPLSRVMACPEYTSVNSQMEVVRRRLISERAELEREEAKRQRSILAEEQKQQMKAHKRQLLRERIFGELDPLKRFEGSKSSSTDPTRSLTARSEPSGISGTYREIGLDDPNNESIASYGTINESREEMPERPPGTSTFLDKAVIQFSYLQHVDTNAVNYTLDRARMHRFFSIRNELEELVKQRSRNSLEDLPPTFAMALEEMVDSENIRQRRQGTLKKLPFARRVDTFHLKFLVSKKRLLDRFLHCKPQASDTIRFFKNSCDELKQLPLFDIPGGRGNAGGPPGGHGGTGVAFESEVSFVESQERCCSVVKRKIGHVWQELSKMIRNLSTSSTGPAAVTGRSRKDELNTAEPRGGSLTERVSREVTTEGMSVEKEGAKTARLPEGRMRRIQNAVQSADVGRGHRRHGIVVGGFTTDGYDSHDDLTQERRIVPIPSRLFHLCRFILRSTVMDMMLEAVEEYVATFERDFDELVQKGESDGNITGIPPIFSVKVFIENGRLRFDRSLSLCLEAAVRCLRKTIEEVSGTIVGGRALGSNSPDENENAEKVISASLPHYSGAIGRLTAVCDSIDQKLAVKMAAGGAAWSFHTDLLNLFEVERLTYENISEKGTDGKADNRRPSIFDSLGLLKDVHAPSTEGKTFEKEQEKLWQSVKVFCGALPDCTYAEPSLPLEFGSQELFREQTERITAAVEKTRSAGTCLEIQRRSTTMTSLQKAGFVQIDFRPLLAELQEKFRAMENICELHLTRHVEKFAVFTIQCFATIERNLVAKPKICADVTSIKSLMDQLEEDLPQLESSVAAVREGFGRLDELQYFPSDRELNLMWTCIAWPQRLRDGLKKTRDSLESERQRLAKELYTRQQILFADVQTILNSIDELTTVARVAVARKREKELRHQLSRLKALRKLTHAFDSDQAHLGETKTDYSFLNAAEAASVLLSLLWSMAIRWLKQKRDWLKNPFDVPNVDAVVLPRHDAFNPTSAVKDACWSPIKHDEAVMSETADVDGKKGDREEQKGVYQGETSKIDASERVRAQIEHWEKEVNDLESTLNSIKTTIVSIQNGEMSSGHDVTDLSQRFLPGLEPSTTVIQDVAEPWKMLPFVDDFIADVKEIKRHLPLISFIKTMKSRSAHWAALASAIKEGKALVNTVASVALGHAAAHLPSTGQTLSVDKEDDMEDDDANRKLAAIKKQLDRAVDEVFTITQTSKEKRVELQQKQQHLETLKAKAAALAQDKVTKSDAMSHALSLVHDAMERKNLQEMKTMVVQDGMHKADEAAIEVQKWTEGLVNEVPQKDFIEISAFVHPPKAVAYLLEAVLILCGVEPKWNTDVFPHEPNYWVVAQYHLRDPKRIQKKMTEVFVDGRVPRERMDIAARYLLLPEFQPESMLKSSKATQYLIHWVYAVKRHFDITETVVPPQGDELAMSQSKLQKEDDQVEAARQRYNAVKEVLKEAEEEEAEIAKETYATVEEINTCKKLIKEEERLLENLHVTREELEVMMNELKQSYRGIVAGKAVRVWRRKAR